MGWEQVVEKFQRLSAPVLDRGLGKELIEAVQGFHLIEVRDFTSLVAPTTVKE